MKKQDIEKIIKILLFIYLIINLFYGIIKKFLVFNKSLLLILTYIPDVLLILILLFMILNNSKNKSKFWNFSIFYIILISLIGMYKLETKNEYIYIFKGVLLPFLLLYFLENFKFRNKNYENKQYIKKIIILFKLYSVFGFILGLVQRIREWEWTSRFYTGRVFYYQDPLTKIKIWHAGGKLRVPSLTGNSVSFSMFSLLILIYFLYSEIKIKNKWFYISSLLGSIYISTNKTSFAIAVLLILIYFMNKIKNKIYYINIVLASLTFSLFFIKFDSKIFFSMKERFLYWESVIENYGNDIFIPVNLYAYSSASNKFFLSVMDNTYLFFLFSFGILGFCMYIKILFYLFNNKVLAIKYLGISIALYSLTTNITQGVSLLSLLFIFKILFILDSKKFNKRGLK